jgi:hypothetical protein
VLAVPGFYVDVARGFKLIAAVMLEGWREEGGSCAHPGASG